MYEDLETPHQRYLQFASRAIGIRGKDVLEVGGCSPPELLANLEPRSWTCANLSTVAVSDFNERALQRSAANYSANVLDITKLEMENAFDLAYSINSFEHVHDVGTAFNRIRRSLKDGGYLFTIFGPIWGSDIGHHLSVPTEDGKGLYYYDRVLAPWEHLTTSRESLTRRLSERYGEKTAERAVDYIFDYGDLNRLFECDYIRIVNNCGLTPVLIVRNKKGRAPDVHGASRTREFLMILKKGPVRTFERIEIGMRCAWAIAAHLLTR